MSGADLLQAGPQDSGHEKADAAMRAPFAVDDAAPAPGTITGSESLTEPVDAVAKPGVTFPGVGCGLAILRDGRLLMAKRMKAPEAGHWTIVGGKVDHGETAAEAARREGEEESGLTIGAVNFLCLSEHIIPADRQHWVSLIYVTEETTGEPWLTEPDKIAEIGWFPLDALPAPMSVFARDAVAALCATPIAPAPDIGHLRSLEECLHQPAIRAVPEAVAALLAEDFLEIGSSGQIYRQRDEMIAAMAKDAKAGTRRTVEAWDYQLRPIAPGQAQLLYRTGERIDGALVHIRLRSSLWGWADGRWQMRFHQGTPAAPDSSAGKQEHHQA